MKLFLKKFNIKLSYIFLILAIILMITTVIIYKQYIKVERIITKSTFSNDMEYTKNIVANIDKLLQNKVKGNLYKTLKNNRKKVEQLESYLQLFVTKRYKYIYVVSKIPHEKDIYRFLLDGSINEEDKSNFGDIYEPFEPKKWSKIYTTKKDVYFTHENLKTLWMTYLKPITRKGKIEAILVIDFSMQGHSLIVKILKELENNYRKALIFFIIIFFIIIFFSYIDFKREKEKDLALLEVKEINITLEEKIKKAVEESRQKDQAMFQQSRLAQMGEMISMIAHQWRQPLAAISATSATINLKTKLNKIDKDVFIELSDKISNYSQHLSATIDDFREFFKSKKEKSNITYTDLINSVLSIVEASTTNKNISIIKELNYQESFNAYSNELKQVLLNLIKNSEDILIENEIKHPYIKIKTYKKDKKLILEVSDNGGGIKKSIIDKVFDPYFSTKTKKDGTGLGLYMSKIIIEEHCDGKIDVSNDENGAVFRIALGGKNA